MLRVCTEKGKECKEGWLSSNDAELREWATTASAAGTYSTTGTPCARLRPLLCLFTISAPCSDSSSAPFYDVIRKYVCVCKQSLPREAERSVEHCRRGRNRLGKSERSRGCTDNVGKYNPSWCRAAMCIAIVWCSDRLKRTNLVES